MDGIRGTSHLLTTIPRPNPRITLVSAENQKQQQELSSRCNNEDDDDSLESLPEHVDNDAKDDHGDKWPMSVENTIQLFENVKDIEPQALLHEHYMKQGCTSGFKTYFQEFPITLPNDNNHWQSQFTCPIEGTVHHSCLPEPLLCTSPNETLSKLCKDCLGIYKVLENNQVAFASKKGAKRSVALKILFRLGLVGNLESTSFSAAPTPSKSTVPRTPLPSEIMSLQPRELEHKWAKVLFLLGVKPRNLKIRYHETLQNNVGWNCKPTLLRCTIEVGEPLFCTTESSPQPSKSRALGDAVRMLLDQCQGVAAVTNDTGDAKNWKSLKLCNPKQVTYIHPLPSWASSTLSPDGCDSIMYVYELEFIAESGNPLVAERTGLDESVITPIGLAFPNDIQATSDYDMTFESQFRIPRKEKGEPDETVTVRLCKKAVFNVSALDSRASKVTTATRLWWMKEFDKVLYDWKSYGKKTVANKIPSKSTVMSDEEGDFSSLLDRTCYFVPLTTDPNGPIDWSMLERVATFSRLPYQQAIDCNWWLPFLGEVNLEIVCCMFALFGLAFLAPGLYMAATMSITRAEFTSSVSIDVEPREFCCGVLLLVLSFLAMTASFTIPPQRHFSLETLENRFLVQAGARNAVYVFSKALHMKQPKVTGMSAFLSPEARKELTQENLERHQRIFKLDLRTASFAEYYGKRHGTTLRFLAERFLFCHEVSGHMANNMLLSPMNDSALEGLAPELVYVLPMPRDVIYILNHAQDFMPLLEREIEVARAAYLMYTAIGGCSLITPEQSTSLSYLLKEATTLSPETMYQRLEFLGDAVLGLFAAMILVARNPSLNESFEDAIGDIFELAVKNHTLHTAALQIGAHRLLHTNRKWNSEVLSQKEMSLYEEVSDRTVSDIAESLLGAAFLQDKRHEQKSKNLAIALFQKLQLPVGLDRSDFASGINSYDVIEICLKHGYPFEKDMRWKKQLSALADFWRDDGVTQNLHDKRETLFAVLFQYKQDGDLLLRLRNTTASALVFSAMFHIDDDNDGSMEESGAIGTDTQSILPLSSCRGMLHFIGANALQVCITDEIYSRFPGATEGDMHYIRACAVTDDVVAYVTVKNGIHKTIENVDLKAVKQFEMEMMVADYEGLRVWKARGGWILGEKTYARRIKYRKTSPEPITPRYPGIAGGRLYGHTSKLPMECTYDLVLAVKAIAGALVLSVGVDGMWHCFGPLFEETFLLSAKELKQEYKGVSTIFG